MKLKYWIGSGLETLLIVLGTTLFYGLIMTLQSQYMDWNDLLMMLPIYLLLFGGVMQLAMTVGVYKLNVNLSLSFGSTRNEVLLGLQLFRLIPTLCNTALICILLALAGENALFTPWTALPIALGIGLACGACGTVIGVAYARFGKLATVLVVLVMVVLGITGGILAVMSSQTQWLQSLVNHIGFSWLVFGIGLILYALAMIPEHRTVWKYSVRM